MTRNTVVSESRILPYISQQPITKNHYINIFRSDIELRAGEQDRLAEIQKRIAVNPNLDILDKEVLLNEAHKVGGLSKSSIDRWLSNQRKGNGKAKQSEWFEGLGIKPGDDGEPEATVSNAELALIHHPMFKGSLMYDVVTDRVEWTREVDTLDGAENIQPGPLRDSHLTKVRGMLDTILSGKLSKDDAHSAIVSAAEANPVDHVSNYLSRLRWDGEPRLDTWLIDYLNAEDSDYTRAVGRKQLIGAVARALTPGCEMHTVLMFVGGQGIGKSRAIKALVPNSAWFTDALPAFGYKDIAIHLSTHWIIELAELSAIAKRDVETVKNMLSQSADRFRPPYGRFEVFKPRRCCFFGSTNADGYSLIDASGNRRFWPVALPDKLCDPDAIGAVRDQLWAEAVVAFKSGEHWWLEEAMEAVAREHQEAQRMLDPWEDSLREWLSIQDEITVGDVLEHLGLENRDIRGPEAKRVVNILLRDGFKRMKLRDGANRRWAYVRRRVVLCGPI
jgi:predicted P-loop ATPase